MERFATNLWENHVVVNLKMPSTTGGKIVLGAAASVAATGLLWKYCFRDAYIAQYLSGNMLLSNARLEPRKKKFFTRLEEVKSSLGRPLVIIDVGSGNGVNFQYYPEDSRVICVDPNTHFEPMLRAGSDKWKRGVRVEQYHVVTCENMHSVVESDTADVVIAGGLFCFVSDIDLCINEIYRVLKPGGMLVFMDHVLSPPSSPFNRRLQLLMSPFWCFFTGGCNLNRTTEPHLRRAGFTQIDGEYFEAIELEKPTRAFAMAPLIKSRYWGTATK